MELEETFQSGGDTLHSASPDETSTTCPASPSASGYRENFDPNDNKIQIIDIQTSGGSNVDANGTKLDQACISMQQADISVTRPAGSFMQTEDALSPYQVQFPEIPDNFKSKTQQQSQELTSTPPKTDTSFLKTYLRPKDISTVNVSDTECLMSDPPLTLNTCLMAQQDNTEPLQKSPDIDNGVKLEDVPLPTPENRSGDVAAQSDTFRGVTDSQDHEKYCEAPKRVFTIVLDMEPQDMQQNVGASIPDVLRYSQGAELFDTKRHNIDISRFPERKSGSVKADFKSLYLDNLESNLSQVADSVSEKPSALVSAEVNELKSTGAKLRCFKNSETRDETHSGMLNSSTSCGSVTECHVSGADATETTFPDVKQEEMIDFCQPEEQTLSSVVCTVEGSVQTGESLMETQILKSDNKQLMAAAAAQGAGAGTGHAEMAEGEKTQEASDPERTETNYSVPERCKSTMPGVESESKLPASLEATELAQEQVGFISVFYFSFLTHPSFLIIWIFRYKT